MVSVETLLNDPECKITFTVHTDASDKQLGAVISQNNKPISCLSKILINPQHNYTMIEKELLSIVECLKQSQGILFGYEINVFPYHKNLIYTTTSESQHMMHW